MESALSDEYVHEQIGRITAAGKEYFYLVEFTAEDARCFRFGCVELTISYRGHRYCRVLDDGDLLALRGDFDGFLSNVFQGMIYGLAGVLFRQPFL